MATLWFKLLYFYTLNVWEIAAKTEFEYAVILVDVVCIHAHSTVYMCRNSGHFYDWVWSLSVLSGQRKHYIVLE